jgi:hypothetical protein
VLTLQIILKSGQTFVGGLEKKDGAKQGEEINLERYERYLCSGRFTGFECPGESVSGVEGQVTNTALEVVLSLYWSLVSKREPPNC